MKKNFLIQNEYANCDITVEIDFSFVDNNGRNIDVIIKDMVDFWQGYKDRLSNNCNNYLNTFLKQLCKKCIMILANDKLSLNGLINEFNDLEGWYNMDGSYGIRIIGYSEIDLDNQDYYNIISL